MVTDISHKVIMGKTMSLLFSVVLDSNVFKLAGNLNIMKSWMSSNCDQSRPLAADLAAVKRLNYPHMLMIGK